MMICVQGNYQVIAKLRILSEKLFHLRKYMLMWLSNNGRDSAGPWEIGE